VPIELHVDGADQEVEAAAEPPDRRGVLARDDVVGPEGPRLVELAFARRERGHVAAVGGGELHGHVPQPADADDADPIGRFRMPGQGCEDGAAPEKQRPRVRGVRPLRQRDGPGPVSADVACEPASVTDDSRLHLRAEVVAARHALTAVHATGRVPADADALPDCQPPGVGTDRGHPADDLVAENRGVLRDAPVVVQDGEIRVTQTAVLDRDLDVFGPERSEINGFEYHRLFRRLRNPCLAGWLVAALGWSGHGYSFLRLAVY